MRSGWILLVLAACSSTPQPLRTPPREREPVVVPAGSHLLRYRLPEGQSYDEQTTREFALEVEEADRRLTWKLRSADVLRRTVLETDDEGRPTIERISVVEMERTIEAAPDQPEGTEADAAEGKTFVWRRRGARWELHDELGNAGERYPRLVGRLRNWRDARLPPGPVAVGDSWEVTAKTFLESVGQPLPPEVDGRIRFRFEQLEGDVARISIDFTYGWREGNLDMRAQGGGIWRLDVARGREVGIEWEAALAAGDKGEGRFSQQRVVTYAEAAGE